jgi:serine/threonine protein kinase
MPHPLALFSLKPLNQRAEKAVTDRSNAHLVSKLRDGDLALDVGHVRTTAGDDSTTLATLGRCGDIFIEGASISKIQCSFEIDRDTNVIMFYDRSHSQTTQVYSTTNAVVPFEYGRARKVVVQRDLNTIIGMGGVGRNLVLFELVWHCAPDMVKEKVRERDGNMRRLQENPRFARTLDEADTVAPSQMETRIHTPGPRQPKIRWQQIGDSLGAGKFGPVYKALNLYSGKIMAVKVMRRPPGPDGDHLWGMLKREVEILSRISHVSYNHPAGTAPANGFQDHIVNYIDSDGWDDGKAEIFMGLKDGTLESLVLSGCPTPVRDLANTVLHHMLQAIDFLSVHSIVHRDLKPENILYLRREGGYHFQLGDFGLSNRQDYATTQVGTPVYMAPEFFSGGRQSSKSDIWSLFVTMLWILDADGFRQRARRATCFDDMKKIVLGAASLPLFSGIREMARIDPETRCSAAQMLVKRYKGVGLTTRPSQVARTIEVAENSTATSTGGTDMDTPMPDANRSAGASAANASRNPAPPLAGTRGNARALLPGMDDNAYTLTSRNGSNTREPVPNDRPRMLTRAATRNQGQIPPRPAQPDPVDALLRQPGPRAVRLGQPTPVTATGGVGGVRQSP